MGDTKLYSAQDIEKLKQKVITYKDTLTTLKTGNSIEEYLFMKKEFNGFKTKITDLEDLIEVMGTKQNVQIEEYEQEITNLSNQINSLNKIVETLNQKILSMTSSNLSKGNNFTSEIKSEKNHSSIHSPPSYKQLRKIFTQSQTIEELPTEKPINPKKMPDGQHLSSLHDQLYNSLQKNSALKLASNRNYHTPSKRISIKLSDIKSFPLPDDTHTQGNTEKKSTKKKENEAPIKKMDKTIHPPEEGLLHGKKEAIQEQDAGGILKSDAIIDQKEKAPIEILNDSESPTIKNKESLSILNFLRKK